MKRIGWDALYKVYHDSVPAHALKGFVECKPMNEYWNKMLGSADRGQCDDIVLLLNEVLSRSSEDE